MWLLWFCLPQLAYAWKLDAPFRIVPSSGVLARGERAALAVVFTPPTAATFDATAACTLDSGEVVTMQVGGWGQWGNCHSYGADEEHE